MTSRAIYRYDAVLRRLPLESRRAIGPKGRAHERLVAAVSPFQDAILSCAGLCSAQPSKRGKAALL